MPALWTVERTLHRRFPFRVTIEQDGRPLLAVRAQSAWPGPGQQVFCLRERALDPEEHLEPLERVPVAHLGRVGRKLTVVLDRPNRKRCEFLVVPKVSEKDGRAYEQVFFRTESGIRAHRSRECLGAWKRKASSAGPVAARPRAGNGPPSAPVSAPR